MTLYYTTKRRNLYYVYLMYDPTQNRYKIGVSSDPEHRLKTFHTVNPAIVLLAKWGPVTRKEAYDMEALAHFKYRRQRLHGEWFRLSQQQVNELLHPPTVGPPEMSFAKLALLALGGVGLAFLVLLLQACLG